MIYNYDSYLFVYTLPRILQFNRETILDYLSENLDFSTVLILNIHLLQAVIEELINAPKVYRYFAINF